MGSGTSVAKESAQIQLLTDDFSTIVSGIKEGRLIFDNLKRCAAYVLSSNVPMIIPYLALIAIRIPITLTTIMSLVICLGIYN
jgi:sodium/potassium-transporting ATPase subunit alpha